MFWKNWPYWLKGGIIGLILGSLFPVLYFALISSGIWGSHPILQAIALILLVLMFLVIPSILGYEMCFMGGSNCDKVPVIFAFLGWILFPVIGFILFSFIGFVYGKIKNRK